MTAVSDADIDAMIENMRGQRPIFTEVARPARDTDRVIIDYQARVGGERFETRKAQKHGEDLRLAGRDVALDEL